MKKTEGMMHTHQRILVHNHTHNHDDGHHDHEHSIVHDEHSHDHVHKDVTHEHKFIIDIHHQRWPK